MRTASLRWGAVQVLDGLVGAHSRGPSTDSRSRRDVAPSASGAAARQQSIPRDGRGGNAHRRKSSGDLLEAGGWSPVVPPTDAVPYFVEGNTPDARRGGFCHESCRFSLPAEAPDGRGGGVRAEFPAGRLGRARPQKACFRRAQAFRRRREVLRPRCYPFTGSDLSGLVARGSRGCSGFD